MNKICENIKNLRLERKLTQQDIAEKMYVTRQCISRWEQGINLPDIGSIERLSKIFNCNVNDIIDNDSLKAIAINEAIKNKKNKKVIFTSIIVSILAIAISIAGFYYINNKEEDIMITHFIKAIVLEKDTESYDLKLKLDERDLDDNESVTFNYNPWGRQKLKIYDNKQEEIKPQDIKIGDIIEISYYNTINPDSIYEIHVIDSKTDKNFYGVIIVANGERYQTYEDIPQDGTPGIRYYLYKTRHGGSVSSHNLGWFDGSSTSSSEKYNNNFVLFKCEFTMNVYFDELKLTENPVIGLVYSTGIEYVETLSPEYSTRRYYDGEISYEVPGDEFLIHSEEVSYNININRIYSFSKIEVYEYDMNHDLLGVTVLEDWYDINGFNARKEAFFAYFKVYSQEEYISFKTYLLNVGDDLNVYLSDRYGLVRDDTIHYTYKE